MATILFHGDEHLPLLRVKAILEPRGHRFTRSPFKTRDATILAEAARTGAVILTADHWFYTQLRRTHSRVRSIYRHAGVVRLPGEWSVAEPLLQQWLPVIEAAYDLFQATPDKRLVIDVRTSTILIDA